MSILRNGNVVCPCLLFVSMSHVEFKKRLSHVTTFLAPMSHVELKKCHVTLSMLGVKGHILGPLMGGGGVPNVAYVTCFVSIIFHNVKRRI